MPATRAHGGKRLYLYTYPLVERPDLAMVFGGAANAYRGVALRLRKISRRRRRYRPTASHDGNYLPGNKIPESVSDVLETG